MPVRRASVLLLAAAVGLGGLLPSCATTIPLHSNRRSLTVVGERDVTATRRMTLDCSSNADLVRIELSGACDAGVMRVRLMDPKGVCVTETELDGGKGKNVLRWPAVVGEWACELELDRFSGDYTVVLQARSEAELGVAVIPGD